MMSTSWQLSVQRFLQPGMQVLVKPHDYFRTFGRKKWHNKSGTSALHPFRAVITYLNKRKTMCHLKWQSNGWANSKPGTLRKDVNVKFLYPVLPVSDETIQARKALQLHQNVINYASTLYSSFEADEDLPKPIHDVIQHCQTAYSQSAAVAQSTRNQKKKQKDDQCKEPPGKKSIQNTKTVKTKKRTPQQHTCQESNSSNTKTTNNASSAHDDADDSLPLSLVAHVMQSKPPVRHTKFLMCQNHNNSCWLDSLLFMFHILSQVQPLHFYSVHDTLLHGNIQPILRKFKCAMGDARLRTSLQTLALQKSLFVLRENVRTAVIQANATYGIINTTLNMQSTADLGDILQLYLDPRSTSFSSSIIYAEDQHRSADQTMGFSWKIRTHCTNCGELLRTAMKIRHDALTNKFISDNDFGSFSLPNLVTFESIPGVFTDELSEGYKVQCFMSIWLQWMHNNANIQLSKDPTKRKKQLAAFKRRQKRWNQALQCTSITRDGNLCHEMLHLLNITVDTPTFLWLSLNRMNPHLGDLTLSAWDTEYSLLAFAVFSEDGIGHYYAYGRIDNYWFHYDDMNPGGYATPIDGIHTALENIYTSSSLHLSVLLYTKK